MNKQENLDLIKEVLQTIPTPEEKAAFINLLGMTKEEKKAWLIENLTGITVAQRRAILDAVSLSKAERAALAGQAIRAVLFRFIGWIGGLFG